MSEPGALVSTQWLEAHLDDPDVRVVETTWYLPTDGRSGREEFEGGHVRGAAFWDIDGIADPDDPRPHMAPAPERFAALMDGLGIGDSTRVVAYDRVGMMTVGRAWWMLRYFGHDAVSILDGGFVKWVMESRPTETGPAEPRAATGGFSAQPRPDRISDLDTILAGLDGQSAQILDARAPGRFAGTEPEPRPGCRAGHIPGSRNLPYNRLVDPETGTVRSPDELRALFADAGIDVDKPVTTTCGSGVTASMLAFGLHLIGQDAVAVYDGSWSEWGMRTDTPVET
ncbi:MAG: 3-mercaptopyruvate sulfurtransferase [Defluviicoccus sp.]|nr:3-mercaptopyruvate sulfurtransferase [Defluviicoccus sp.]